MKRKLLLVCWCLLVTVLAHGQYSFPSCWTPWTPNAAGYPGGTQVSHKSGNYQAKWSTITEPGTTGDWTLVSKCGDGGIGGDYTGPQRIIGYLPYWVPDFDFKTYDPGTVNHVNIAFNLFQQNNNNYNSSNFASIAWGSFHNRKVDSILFDNGVLARAHAKGTTVSVAIGGATDFAFLWLLTQYYNNDVKLEEMASFIANYVNTKGIDGVDLDLECWWPDAAISGTTEQGGRVRGDKWGGPDQGPHPAAVGLTRLAQKLRQKMPTKLLSAAVFGTSYYGNNYDDALSQYVDWLGLMTYDFTGSWNTSPIGPHAALYKVPLGTYQGQTADNPIYSAEDALEYWMGMAPAAWNHDGGFNVLKAKLCIGVPFYGYDLATRKPDNANGFVAPKWKEIVAAYPNAATSFDPQDSRQLGGYIGANGKKIYYETPKGAAEKIKYTKRFGHQGVIIWELTGDTGYNSGTSLLKAINDAGGVVVDPVPTVSITSPANNATFAPGATITITATAADNGTVTKVQFFQGSTLLGEDATAPYSYTWNTVPQGSYTLTARATDNKGGVGTSATVLIGVGNVNPTVGITAPANNATYLAPASVTITATATDADGTISKVEFYQGTTLLGEDATSPYAYTWANVAAGSYALTAKAYDNTGGVGTSAGINITVSAVNTCTVPAWLASTAYSGSAEVSRNGNRYQARWWTQGDDPALKSGPDDVWKLLGPCGSTNVSPTVAITAPTVNAIFTAPATVSIAASASDSDGTITNVEFFQGSVKLGEDASAPYTFSWTTVAAGTYSLTTRATDNAGGMTTSAAVSITVNGTQTNTPPVTAITAPAHGASFTVPASITITATATDSDGTINRVEFYNGALLLGTDNSSPYSFTWTNVAAGSYTLSTKAVDNGGASGTSSSVTVTITGGTDNCASLPQYTENGGYVAGSKVKNAGAQYECKEYPFSGWCNGAAWAYAPGTGTYWADAWILKGSCGASARTTSVADDVSMTVSDADAAGLILAPNPAVEGERQSLTLSFDAIPGHTRVALKDMNGRALANFDLGVVRQYVHTVELPALPAGMYVVRVQTEQKTWLRKYLVKK
jgi:GH18 family chitinase/chitodextrinase